MSPFEGIANPLMSVTLISGLWWMLPLLASTCVACKNGMKLGYWAKECRIGFKVRGACACFKMLVEAKKVQMAVVKHMLVLYPLTTAKFDMVMIGNVKTMCRLFERAKIVRGWTNTITQNLWGLGGIHYTLAFYIVQIGCILVKRGLSNTWIYKLMEVQCDIIITKSPGVRFTFKQLVREALKHPNNFRRMLTTFIGVPDWSKLPLFRRFHDILVDDLKATANLMNSLPKCIVGCIVFVRMFDLGTTARAHYRVEDYVEFKIPMFEEYMKLGHDAPSGKWQLGTNDLGRECVVYHEE